MTTREPYTAAIRLYNKNNYNKQNNNKLMINASAPTLFILHITPVYQKECFHLRLHMLHMISPQCHCY